MSTSPDQIQQALQIIEAQLAVIKQAVGQTSSEETPGITGIFDGEYMVTEEGKRFQVPPNYASKSMLVPGDTVKMVEDPAGGMAKFKQTVKAERLKTTGLLARKDGKFEVLSEEGSFKVLSAAIKHYEGEPGDSVTIQYPKQHVKGSYAAVEKVVRANTGSGVAQPASESASVPELPQFVAPVTSIDQSPAAPPVEEVKPEPAPAPAPASAPVQPEAVVPPPPPMPAPTAPIQTAPATLQHTDKVAPEAKPKVQPAKPASSDRPRSTSSAPRPASSANRPKPTNQSSASASRPAAAPAPRPAAPAPKPAPAAQTITPGAAGEISVSSVMEEDDLV